MLRLLRAVVPLTCLLLVGGLGVGATSAPAAANSTRLCIGYDACRQAGMPHHGYQQAGARMYWLMYAGHNCTNYAAYRMTQSGLPNIRPWSGGGNAMYWGVFNAALTDSTPAVGAVAWWKANVPGAGSAGHVAYVERVVSPDEIIVSQDSWGGDFSWARITRSGTGWPSGFVHFNDVPLRNTARPAVSGTPKVGEVLTASTGSWTPSDARYAYRWRADGVAITGARGRQLTLGPAQLDKRISVRVIASKLGYPTTRATSSATSAVQAAALTNTVAPTMTGDPRVGSTLTASPGEWTPAPTTLTYQWTTDGNPIAGATAPTFTPRAALTGRTLAVTVTASQDGYASVSAAAAAARVAPGMLTVTARPVVSGTARPGETLTFEPPRFTPRRRAAVAVQWLRAGVPIEGAVGPTYQLTTGDLGRRVTARATLTRPGYEQRTARAPATSRVKSVPHLRVRTEPGRRRLTISVRVTAEGVRRVAGSVRIGSRGTVLENLTLDGGSATTTLRGLPHGRRSFRIRYLGSREVSAAGVLRTSRIR
ncbi:MAG TPA: CHAP domain-containing protein [Nocardioidaceae bacterium]|nr:CHAP domain-containing protein [Nocardioidaceae bacterium]